MGLTCRDVMVPPHIQKTVEPTENVATALRIIKESRARFLPVVDTDGTYVGVFTAPTLLKLILPKAVTMTNNPALTRMGLDNLNFMNLSKADFEERIDALKDERVADNMSLPENIPVTTPDTPVMEGIFMINKFKRHVILVEEETQKFVGTVSANSLLDSILNDT